MATTLVAAVPELWRAWPSGSAGGGFLLLLIGLVLMLTALWTAPLSAATAGALWALRKVRPTSERAADLRWLPIAPLAVFLCVSAGQVVHAAAAKAIVRQDLASAVVPLAQLIVFAIVIALCAFGYRWVREPLGRVPRWGHLAATAVGASLLGGIHLARFPALLDDAKVPMAIQILVAIGVAVGVAIAPERWLKWRPAWISAGVCAAIVIALFVVMLFGARVAPMSYPVASAALQTRGLTAARIAGLTARIGDSDGDGFSRYFGGLDCDDGNAAINPLAKDLPGNGVDEDCFEGDLQVSAVEAERQARVARNGRPPRERARNLILITIDALRADAVGFGGAEHPTTPVLDRIAERGAVFERAYSHAPMTRKAFPSLLAGKYPSNIHWLDLQTKYPYPVSHDDNLYLAEVVRSAGIETGHVIAFNYAKNSRFDQGFSFKKVHPASRSKKEINADKITRDAVAQLKVWGENPSKPRFFLWLHFYEAHFPYVKHKQFSFGKSDHERYLAEVRWIDSQLEQVFTTLDELGLADDTALVITGDHGEEFGEHGGEHHGDLYTEDLHVPLVIAAPGGKPGRFSVPVGLTDIAPTVLELLGIAIPPDFDGDSLVSWMEGAPPPEQRFVYAEVIPDKKVPRRIMTYIGKRWQLIVDFQLGSRELYDLANDPTAQHNAFVDAPAQAQRMETLLRRHMALRVGPIRETKASSARKQ